MTASMPQTITEERLQWVLPIIRSEISLSDCAKVFPHGKRTLERWVAAYRARGEAGLEPRSTRPRTQPGETPIAIKERIIQLRRQKKVCALKLKWKLEKEGIVIHERTIGKIIKAEGMVRRYRVKKTKYKYIKIPLQPGDLMEIDVKFVPEKIAGRQYFQYTAIDCATRWRYLAAYDRQTNGHSITFLKAVIRRFPHRIRAVKTDNGSIFTNYYTGTNKRSNLTVKTIHAFDVFCQLQRIIHYLIDPGKPAQNGKVERSHRSDQESFYRGTCFTSLADLQKKLRRWNRDYNNLEHCSLNGKTPNEMLAHS